MKRRQFHAMTLAGGLAPLGLLGLTVGRSSRSEDELDSYGGWKGKTFPATGFFRTEKDDRWWLVTPEGNAFLSFGINHLHPGLFRQHHNRDAWREQLGVADLQDDAQFGPALRRWFLETCREFGFNTVGVHNGLELINRPAPALPYLQTIEFVEIPHWSGEIADENFVDVFSEAFVDHCDRLAQKIAAPLRDDPYLVGYAMTDCPLFTEEDCRERTDVVGGARRESRIGWPRRLRNLGAEAPGKRAYVELVDELYRGSIADFNATYGTSFASFDALASAVGWRPHTDLGNANETRDNVAFLHRVVARYYQTARDAIRRHDPNHLFVGDKINANTDSLDTVLPVTSRFTDIVFYQMYARYEVQKPGLDRWSRVVDQPVVNGDSSFTMITDTMPRPFGPVADDLAQRVEWTDEFFRRAFSRPEFVGWHYCGLIAATNLIPRKRDRQHSGLIDSWGEPYAPLQTAMRDASRDLYRVATGRV